MFFFVTAQKQVLPHFPDNQNFYKGGYTQFHIDAHQFLIDNNYKECENKNESYMMKILVNDDGSVNYIKDPDSIAVKSNKCTFDLARKVLSNLKNYVSAEVNGIKTPAITRIIFNSGELFSSTNFLPNKDLYKDPEFPGGIENYRKKFISCFDTNGYNYSQSFRFVINFEVDTQGNFQNIYIDTDFDNDKFVSMIVDCVVPRKLKFKPGTYNGTPITLQFSLPVSISAD